MKHAVILAHPRPTSLTAAAAKVYADAVQALGHEVVVRDLYGMGFDPCLKAREIPRPEGYAFEHDVLEERRKLADVDVFALVYPLWFNAPPAMLKGYVDRVFSMDFGYAPAVGGTEPLLDGRRLISFTFSGAPDQWVRDTGAMQALMSLFDRHLCATTGLRLVDHVHTGGVVSGLTRETADDIFARIRGVVGAQFAPEDA